ncbi:conserved hypothetical protein [Beutenbergia cavernae DSM 12333]|uniref:AB hydrolase-1 domain-containing protein n=1 Tax=Beutenbergia cavernae (strain ATCC BAA-8 / DSM 12333 / CCUG 43141 / JCM 11478 / NBRC 16432 / NCIMB 13614 / HKI 0122) TaxID=471853 RepID=C5C3B9_BEUC1|nr:hypothetical protein [Beutenbergia cavernae]ACQ79818.1 conserved hypothetical protein [Beutenbergia cavernae DSM 12333]
MATEPDHTTTAVLHDGSLLEVRAWGAGAHLVLPERTRRLPPAEADNLRAWGGDPDYGLKLAVALAERACVVTADVTGHRLAHPAPDTLTPENLVADVVAIADAAGADGFAYVGYSWLALAGLQVAARTDRLTRLAMGGFPPVDGPYDAMLAVTRASHERAATPPEPAAEHEVTPGDWDTAEIRTDEQQTRQFVTLYEALQGFDDRRVAEALTIPRLAFAGADDDISYGPDWGGVRVPIAETLRRTAPELEAAGWSVRLLDGLDHLGAMHADVVLPLLSEWWDDGGR